MEPATAMLVGGGIQAASSLAGGLINRMFDDSERQWQQNLDAQREFAQNSIQWRVQDAQKAGIHPLFAIGGQMPGYTPSSSFSTDNMGESIAQAGNAVGRTMGQIGLMNAQLENANLQNQKLKTEISKDKVELLDAINNLAGATKPTIAGQKSDTIPHITKQLDNTLWLTGSNSMRNLPDQMESEIASIPSDLAKVWDTQYSRGTHEKLPEIPGKKKIIMLSPLGYSSKYVDAKDPSKDMDISDIAAHAFDRFIEFGSRARKKIFNFFKQNPDMMY